LKFIKKKKKKEKTFVLNFFKIKKKNN